MHWNHRTSVVYSQSYRVTCACTEQEVRSVTGVLGELLWYGGFSHGHANDGGHVSLGTENVHGDSKMLTCLSKKD